MIRLSKSVIGEEEIRAVTNVLNKEYLGMGDNVKEFEDLLTVSFRRPCVCVNTGTSAIHLALQAIGVGPQDEVLVQSLTYVATFQAISATGATAIPCEIYPDSITIDLEDAKNKITANTKAIIPVHYGGSPGDLKALYQFANKYNLRVIEDAAHAFGTSYEEKLIGSFGDICCFSFDGIKNITSGEGGAILTDDKYVLNKIKDARLLGVMKDTDKRYAGERSWDFDVENQGWRFHMSNIMAAIGIEQFKKFKYFKDKRQHLAKIYQNAFYDFEEVEILNHDYNQVVPHIFSIKVDANKRDSLQQYLKAKGIQTGIHYFPNHLLTKFRIKGLQLALTEKIYKTFVTLPLHPDLEDEHLITIINEVKSFLARS